MAARGEAHVNFRDSAAACDGHLLVCPARVVSEALDGERNINILRDVEGLATAAIASLCILANRDTGAGEHLSIASSSANQSLLASIKFASLR